METSRYTDDVDPLLDIKVYFQMIMYPIMLFFGIVGNTLCFLVMNLPTNRSSVMCLYLKVLAIMDTLSLLFWQLPQLVFNIRPNLLKMRAIGNLNCEFLYLFGCIVFNVSLWQVLIVAIDRYIVVKFPLKASVWCTMKKAKILMTTNVAFHILIYFPNAVRFSELDETGLHTKCVLPEYLEWYFLGFNIINTIADVILPLGSLFILNIAIILCLRKQSSEILGASSESKVRNKQETSMTIMLIVIVTSLLILILPYTVEFIVWQCCLDDILVSRPAARVLSYELCFTVSCANSAVNFYLYLASSSKFKEDVRSLLCCRLRKKVPC
jgi:hypothetical protein